MSEPHPVVCQDQDAAREEYGVGEFDYGEASEVEGVDHVRHDAEEGGEEWE